MADEQSVTAEELDRLEQRLKAVEGYLHVPQKRELVAELEAPRQAFGTMPRRLKRRSPSSPKPRRT